MMTLKQAFSVAALQQSVRTQSQQCDSCPMQQLHRLCERIEGRKLAINPQLISSVGIFVVVTKGDPSPACNRSLGRLLSIKCTWVEGCSKTGI